MYEAYSSQFIGLDIGRATAITTVLLASLLVVVGAQLLLLRSTER
jgi:ABC-type sugar transport system permease subunit